MSHGWARVTRPRRRPSPRSALVWTTVVFLVLLVALSIDRSHQTSAYRDGTAPQRHGVVVSGAPSRRQMTCGRSNEGWQVDVSYRVGDTVRTGALPTCSPSHYPLGRFLSFWEERPGVLTLSPPGRTRHILEVSLAVLVVVWLGLSAFFLSRLRAQRSRA